jgi:glycine oxidase
VQSFDVVVVGGGLIGSSIAFELASQNLRVALLDARQPGREASWAAAGMLSPGPDSPQALPLVPLAQESFRLYPEFVRAIENESGMSVAFSSHGALEIFAGPDAAERRDERIAKYKNLGLVAELISIDSAMSREPALNPNSPAIAWLPLEATVDPRPLIDATLSAAGKRGVEILPDHGASALLGSNGGCTGVLAGGQRIFAKHVVIAAGSFCAQIDERSSGSPIDISRYAPTHPVRGQMLALRSTKVRLKKVLRSEHGYIVPRADGRIIAGSTLENVGFVKENTKEGLRQIFDAAIALAPALAAAEIVETWAGLRPGSPDQLPILGPTDIPGLLIATGHYRNGILLAPVTAKLIRDWIVEGKTNFNAQKFSPLRFSAATSQPILGRGIPAAS